MGYESEAKQAEAGMEGVSAAKKMRDEHLNDPKRKHCCAIVIGTFPAEEAQWKKIEDDTPKDCRDKAFIAYDTHYKPASKWWSCLHLSDLLINGVFTLLLTQFIGNNPDPEHCWVDRWDQSQVWSEEPLDTGRTTEDVGDKMRSWITNVYILCILGCFKWVCAMSALLCRSFVLMKINDIWGAIQGIYGIVVLTWGMIERFTTEGQTAAGVFSHDSATNAMYMIETGRMMKLWCVFTLCFIGFWLAVYFPMLWFVVWSYANEVGILQNIAEEEDKEATVNYITEEVYEDFEPCLPDIEIRRANAAK